MYAIRSYYGIVGGYQFGSEKDAKLAQLEEKKIDQLEGRMKYEDEFQKMN